MKTYAFIFARGGSKGVPGKNIKEICGKPLIAYSIEIAKEIEYIEKIYVSTEDDNIANVAKKYGADIIPRPHNLAQDDSPEWLAWQHAVKWLGEKGESFDIFVSLPATSPLRNKKDITQCLRLLSVADEMNIKCGYSELNHIVLFKNDIEIGKLKITKSNATLIMYNLISGPTTFHSLYEQVKNGNFYITLSENEDMWNVIKERFK